MYLAAHRIAVAGRAGHLVPPTSLAVAEHQVVYVESDMDRSTALGLALTGRMRIAEGELDYRGDDNLSLADVSALVDAPGITAPIDSIDVRDAVAEELAIAGKPSGRRAVREWLAQHGRAHLEGRPVEALSGTERIELYCALAVSRRRIRLLVLDTPDRHDSPLHEWQAIAEHYAHNGYAVIVICDDRSTTLLGVDAYRVGRNPDLPPPPTEPDGAPLEPEPADPAGPAEPVDAETESAELAYASTGTARTTGPAELADAHVQTGTAGPTGPVEVAEAEPASAQPDGGEPEINRSAS